MIASTCIIMKSFDTAFLRSRPFSLLGGGFWLDIFDCLELSKRAFGFFHVFSPSHVATWCHVVDGSTIRNSGLNHMTSFGARAWL